MAEGWLETEWDYRIYATGALEKIHSDTTARKCLELLPQDQDLDIRTRLADAFLGQLADEGIEPVRAMVEQRDYDSMTSDLMQRLVAVSTVVGVTLPEYPIWKREVAERLAEQERRTKELLASFQAPANRPLPAKAAAREPADFLQRKPAPFLAAENRVGRNDPCPCGSGKKFKKCCLNRGKS